LFFTDQFECGTKGQQKEQIQDDDMIQEIRTIYLRSHKTIIQDAVGAASLGVILVAGLCFPGLV
jgi:hypothetical protein